MNDARGVDVFQAPQQLVEEVLERETRHMQGKGRRSNMLRLTVGLNSTVEGLGS